MKSRVLTGFSEFGDGELDLAAAAAVKGLTDNASFKLGETLTQFSNGTTVYHDSLSELATGGKVATEEKNNARLALLPLFTDVAIMVNQQANGDRTKLLTSGIKLAAAGEHHYQPMPVNFQVKNGDNGTMVVGVTHSPVGDHGTVFAFTPATNTATDPNTWTQKTANGHKATLTGLTPGLSYRFTAAYKGTDDDVLVWAPPVSKIVSD